MSTSIRERILQAVMVRLQPVAQAFGAGLYRSPVIALTRAQCPALVVFPESEVIKERNNTLVTRELLIRVVALARESPPDPPEILVDRLITAAHAAFFMPDTTLGGLALAVHEVGSEWDIEDADATAVSMVSKYLVTYRTARDDLTFSP
ncbi:conserved hypothetical protein [Gammaproteobacteria bacterium]